MLTRIAPQKVQDATLDYVVQVADRFSVEYVEASRVIRVEVDFGPTIGVYKDSIAKSPDGKALTNVEETVILARVVEALQFMGSKTEIL